MTDVIAWLALGLSGVSLVAQGIMAFRKRRRLNLTAFGGSSSDIINGEPRSVSIVVVRAHAVGGPIGIEDLTFEWNPKPTDGSGWGAVDGEPGQASGDFFSSHPPLQEGETAVWTYRFHAGPDPSDLDSLYQVRAVATRLHSRRKVRSGAVFIRPSISPGPMDVELFARQHAEWDATNTRWIDDDAVAIQPWGRRLWEWYGGLFRR